MRLLLIEDEPLLRQQLARQLLAEGFRVDEAEDGETGLYNAREYPCDLAIVDLGLPRLSGLDLIRQLRAGGSALPILILTARGRWQEKVEGLEAGADDYLTKPFSFDELTARIRALLRRGSKAQGTVLKIDNLILDPATKIAKRNDKTILLSAREYALLEYFMRNQGIVLSKTQILEHVWDYNSDSMSNIVDVFIANLRKKIDGGHEKKLIHTVHGVGYKVSSEEN